MSFKMKQYEDDEEIMAQINIIPLVDVSLVLLIIFMVTVNQIILPSIKLNLPESTRTKTTSSNEVINVSITSEGIVYLDEKIVSLKELESQVRVLHEKSPQAAVAVSVDKSTYFQRVIDALDVLNSLGISKLDIRTLNQ